VWTTAGVKLGTVVDAPPDVQGWREVALATPVAVTSGTTYRVSRSTNNATYGYNPTPPVPTSASGGLTFVNGGWYTDTVDSFPNITQANLFYSIDVVLSVTTTTTDTFHGYDPYIDYFPGDTVTLHVPGSIERVSQPIKAITIETTDTLDFTTMLDLSALQPDTIATIADSVNRLRIVTLTR